MTYHEIETAFRDESFDLVAATETQILEYCDKSGNGDAFSRWLDYQEELNCLLAELEDWKSRIGQ